MADVDKLNQTTLPPRKAFYSSLTYHNISLEDYQFCQKVWEDGSRTSFKEFLVWYNDLDVGPFVMVVERFQRYYFDRNIHILKTAI